MKVYPVFRKCFYFFNFCPFRFIFEALNGRIYKRIMNDTRGL
jgi:hypothetical protein